MLLLFLFFGQGNWGLERVSILLKVTQLVSGGVGTEIQISLTPKASEEERTLS